MFNCLKQKIKAFVQRILRRIDFSTKYKYGDLIVESKIFIRRGGLTGRRVVNTAWNEVKRLVERLDNSILI